MKYYDIFMIKKNAMDIETSLDNLYASIDSRNHKQAAYKLYNVIQLKIVESEWSNYYNSLYKDVKGFIHHYILAVELEAYGYDFVSIEKLLKAINALSEYDEKIKLLQFAYLKLHKAGLDDEVGLIRKEQKKVLITSIFHSNSLLGKFKALIYCCFYNFWTILGISIILIFTYYLLTLPLLDESDAWFIMNGKEYDENLWWNHFANILGATFGFNDEVYCQPTTLGTEMLLIFYKIIGSVIVSGCLLKYIGRYFCLKILEYED